MTKETQIVWKDEDDQVLIRQQKPNEYYIPLSTVTLKTIIELRDACSNIIISSNTESLPNETHP